MSLQSLNKSVVRSVCVVAAAAGVGFASLPVMADTAITVPVANPSFEAQVLAPGSFFFSPTPITGWTATATGGSDRGVWNFGDIGQDGVNVAFVNALDSLAQDLSHAIVANSTYTVEFQFGSHGTSSSGVVELYAGGTVTNGVVTGGTFLNSVVVTRPLFDFNVVEHMLPWTSPLSGLLVGENLSIRLAYGSSGLSPAMFDNIRVSYVLIPEPASALLLLAGGLLLPHRRRRA